MALQIAIVGAGVTGLPAIKECLEYGLEPVCFERADEIGGIWYYRDEVVEGEPSIMRSTIINSSKEMTAYSDFPPPETLHTFMRNFEFHSYLKMYAEHFGLMKYIRLNTEVTRVEQAADYHHTGRWKLIYRAKGLFIC